MTSSVTGETVVTPDEARKALERFIASHFRNQVGLGELARFSIPADPNRDDDLILSRFIEQASRYRDALELIATDTDGLACSDLPHCQGIGPHGHAEDCAIGIARAALYPAKDEA